MTTEVVPVPEQVISVVETPADAPVEQAAPEQALLPIAEAIPAPPAVVPPPPLPPSPERIQQELMQMQAARAAELRAREQQVQQQEDAQALAAYQAQEAAKFVEKYGLAPEQADELAAEKAQILYQNYQTQQATGRVVQQAQAKMQVATILAQRHNVPIAALMACDSPQQMEMVATQAKQSTELQELRTELAKFKKGQVPAQHMDTGVGIGANANLEGQMLEKAVAAGTVAITPEISARLNKYWNS